MNRHLTIKTSRFCVAYTDVGEEREHGCGSFVKLRNSLAITRVSRLESESFNQQSVRPRLNQRLLKLFMSLLLFFGNINNVWPDTLDENSNQENPLKLHVIYSENVQEIMRRLSLSVYEDELSMQQIGELYDNTNELYLAAKKLSQALPSFDLSTIEKKIFENMANQLQIEANNLGYMTQNKDKEGMRIIYKRLNDTCIACHELFRF